MSSITVSQALQRVLRQLTDVTELRDEDGNTLGIYTPNPKIDDALYERAAKLFDPEETRRILAEERGQGVPLEAFWKEMHAREKQ